MTALFINTVGGVIVLNLSNVTHVEIDGGGASIQSLDIHLLGSAAPIRFPLSGTDSGDAAMNRFRMALRPLYEGRQGTVLGIELWLNIADLQPERKDVF